MKIKSLVLTAALLGGLSVPAHAVTPAAHDRSVTAVKFEAPVPTKVVQPIMLPTSHKGSMVTLTMTIDETGRPRNVRVKTTHDQDAYKRIVATVSQWEFSPARRDGVPVSSKIELPLEVMGL